MASYQRSTLRSRLSSGGLLPRLAMIYGLGSLLLSTVIAFATFTIAQNRLLSQFQTDAELQFAENIAETRVSLVGLTDLSDPETTGAILSALDDKLQRTAQSDSLLLFEGLGMRLSNRSFEEIPIELVERLQVVEAAAQFYEFQGEKRYIAGANLDDGPTDQIATYYEIHSLEDLDRTLDQLRSILIGAAIISSLAGAVLGYYAGKRSLAPISRISQAAKQIADGDYQTRLDLQNDPNLSVLSRSFNNMVDELNAKAERDQRFTSDVSHELRTPLMTLTASLELLERKSDELPESARQAVELIGQDIGRFQGLVEDLLEISRLDAGAEAIAMQPILVKEFLAHTLAVPKYSQVELEYASDSADLVITADKRRLRQVIVNLLNNAEKYAGGATSVSFRAVGDSVQIAIEDLGPGIDPAEIKTIFERFSRGAQTAGNRQAGSGVGLGLSLVTEHIALHGGQVWATQRKDGRSGARFVVELPADNFEDDTAPPLDEPAKYPIHTQPRKQLDSETA